MSKPIELTDENLEETLSNSSVPVLVDYWAEWCGPCRMVGPVVDELAKEYEGKAVIGKLNVDTEFIVVLPDTFKFIVPETVSITLLSI